MTSDASRCPALETKLVDNHWHFADGLLNQNTINGVQMFELIQPTLNEVLCHARDGKLQLPDFQRGWVWEEDAIASLLASIVRSFPVGALLTLKTGGATHFEPRSVEGAPSACSEPDELLLDGQQRVTSLFQALMRDVPVDTRTAQGKRLKVYYYFNVERALEEVFSEDAVEIIDESKIVRKNFGRDIMFDFSNAEGEYAAMRFPINRVFDSDDWFNGWMKHWNYSQERIELFQKFRKSVIDPIKNYVMPIIRLGNETTKEAVCLVFEKVNTGGKKLDAFELLTAMFAASGIVNLRTDWYGEKGEFGREKRLHEFDVLKGIQRTDFLRAVSLAHTYGLRRTAEATGKTDKELPAISCKHAALLDIPAEAYVEWRDLITKGFENAARFLHGRGLFWWKDIPYPSQIIVLATLFALRKNKPLNATEAQLIERWYWCGVFGELYGSSTDTKLANDIEDLPRWISGAEIEPRTVSAAIFSESRLDTLYIRTSAAYKGVHALLMKSGAKDFLTGERVDVANFFSENFDIHHIFPRHWCENQYPRIPRERYNTIVNKSAISARINRKIGGRAPSSYCAMIDKETSAIGVVLNEILESHEINPKLLRADNFDAFYTTRKAALLDMIENAMGKAVMRDGAGQAEDYDMDQMEEALAA